MGDGLRTIRVVTTGNPAAIASIMALGMPS